VASTEAKPFDVGRESADGAFVRQQSAFRDHISTDGSTEFAWDPGRYHLYVALACPWSHRAVIVRKLTGLEDAIGVSYAHPFRDERGWAFPGDGFTDAVNGWDFLSEGYEQTDPSFEGRVTVPLLWDKQTGRAVSNESQEIVRMFDAVGQDGGELYPEHLRAEIDEVNELVYENVNNGVYRAGFSRTQEAYDEAFDQLFAALDELDERLGSRRYLTGDTLTEADWRLFVTLVRFDAVYVLHFRCNRNRLVDFPNLWAYTRELYQRPGIAETVAMDQIKRHYYTTHDELNPKRIIPRGPRTDFDAPHGRG
jgi:putative glutathione S-transferase